MKEPIPDALWSRFRLVHCELQQIIVRKVRGLLHIRLSCISLSARSFTLGFLQLLAPQDQPLIDFNPVRSSEPRPGTATRRPSTYNGHHIPSLG